MKFRGKRERKVKWRVEEGEENEVLGGRGRKMKWKVRGEESRGKLSLE